MRSLYLAIFQLQDFSVSKKMPFFYHIVVSAVDVKQKPLNNYFHLALMMVQK